jgi:hypothetical protein
VGPRAGLDTVVKRKIPNPRRESNLDHPAGKIMELFLLATASRSTFATHFDFYIKGIGGSFRGVKRPGREADYLPPSRDEVKYS